MLKKIIITGCIIFASGLLFTNIYTSLVDARSWASAMPTSVYAARAYFKTVNPGDFFRIFSPVHQVLAVLLFISCWKMGVKMRWLCLAALLVALGADAFTFAYFYPRNAIIFTATDVSLAEKAVSEWAVMNWVRSALIAIGTGLYFVIQQKILTYKSATHGI